MSIEQQHCAYADSMALTSASCSLRVALAGAPGTGLSRWTVAKRSAASPTDSRTDSSDRPAYYPACPAALCAALYCSAMWQCGHIATSMGDCSGGKLQMSCCGGSASPLGRAFEPFCLRKAAQ